MTESEQWLRSDGILLDIGVAVVVIREKVVVKQLTKKLAFYGTRRSITMLTQAAAIRPFHKPDDCSPRTRILFP